MSTFPPMSPGHYIETLIHGAKTSSIGVQVSELVLLQKLMDCERDTLTYVSLEEETALKELLLELDLFLDLLNYKIKADKWEQFAGELNQKYIQYLIIKRNS